jgi:hypothetical protein
VGMRFKAGVVWMGMALLAALFSAGNASAQDLTVHCRFHFLNGDTLTRANYYGDGRVRMTTSDGNEVIYDVRTKNVIYLTHARKQFWKGPLDRANTVVDSLTAVRYQAYSAATDEERQKWVAYVDKFNNSIKSESFEYVKKIAGRNCDGYKISVGNIMVHTRWINRDVMQTDYIKDLEKISLLATVDPVGRSIVRLITKAEKGLGLPLAATTEINTPTQTGTFSWEAYTIDKRPIPDSIWQVPEGYTEIKL